MVLEVREIRKWFRQRWVREPIRTSPPTPKLILTLHTTAIKKATFKGRRTQGA